MFVRCIFWVLCAGDWILILGLAQSGARKIVFGNLSTNESVGRGGDLQKMLWRELRLGTFEEAFVQAEK